MSPSNESRKERRRLEDQEEILTAAESLFLGQGFRETTMLQIAQRAAFSVGKLYLHFRAKEEIFAALQARALREFEQTLEEPLRPDDAPLEALRQILEVGFAAVARKRSFIRLEISENLDRPRQTSRPLRDLIHRRMTEFLAAAVAAGDLRPVAPDLLATMIVGAVEALIDALAASDAEDPFTALPGLIMDLMVLPHTVHRPT